MIPILYPREEVEFTTNGIGRLADCVSFDVTEERNGIFEAEFKYPITGRHYADIEEGMIVYAIHDDTKTPQPFRIYGRSAPISGLVTVYAHHISYDLGNIILRPFTASSCADAIGKLRGNTYTYCPFTFWTDKTVTGAWNLRTPRPLKEMLGGTDGSLLDVYGTGEYKWDKWTVKLYVSRGRDTGIRIQYGKNLADLTHEVDYSGIYSAVVPFWQDSNDPNMLVTLPEQFIGAPESVVYNDVWCDESGNQMTDENSNVFEFDYAPMTLTTMDLSGDFQDQPTPEQLRAKAQSRLDASEAWLPDDNVTIDFVQLWQTAEYASVAPLERVSLCDTVDVYYPALGVVAKQRKVVRVVYDVLLERYSSMEIGTAKVSFADTVKSSTEDVIAQNYPSKGMMADAIQSATAQITGEHGGYIKYKTDANGEPTELLVMDAPDEAQAVKIWRWNLNGLGYSRDSGQTYGLAMTQDGAIVADFITTGTLAANLIKAGVLADTSGKFSLDMQTGTLTMDSAQLTNANVSGDITANTLTLGANASVPYAKVTEKPDLTLYVQKDGTIGTTPAEGQTGFVVSSAGLLKASNAVIYGTVYASAGKFAGEIQAGSGKIGTGATNQIIISANATNAALYNGMTNIGSTADGFYLGADGIALGGGKFKVTKAGALTATNATIEGTVTTKSTAHSSTSMESGGITLYYDDKRMGRMTTTGSGATPTSFAISADETNAKELRLGYANSSGTHTAYIVIAKDGRGGNTQKIYFLDTSRFSSDVTVNSTLYANWADIANSAWVRGGLYVTGTKSRIVDTSDYGTRALYCYETPSPMFGDIGEGVIGEDGSCYVWLDPILTETIRTSGYQVFLQRYGQGDAYVAERRQGCFVVMGDPGTAFGWELKAKQADFAEKRFEKDIGGADMTQADYGQLAADYITDLKNGRLAA